MEMTKMRRKMLKGATTSTPARLVPVPASSPASGPKLLEDNLTHLCQEKIATWTILKRCKDSPVILNLLWPLAIDLRRRTSKLEIVKH